MENTKGDSENENKVIVKNEQRSKKKCIFSFSFEKALQFPSFTNNMVKCFQIVRI